VNNNKTCTNEYEPYIHVLNNTFIGQFLSEPDLAMIFSYHSPICFPANHVILHQGKLAEGIYLIISGHVEIRIRIMGEGDTPISSTKPGYFLGEASFIQGGPNTTSAVTTEPTCCILLPQLFFELLENYHPQLRYKILQALATQICERLEDTHDRVKDYISCSNMLSQSFFGKVLNTIYQPKQISLEEVDNYSILASTLFTHFTPAEIETLFSKVTFFDAPAHCVLIHEKQKYPSCYVVVRGAVQSTIMQAKLSVIGPRSLFAGVSCIVKHKDFTISFITCERSLLIKIDEEACLFFQNEKIALWYKLFDLITASMVALRKSIDKLDVRLHIETYNR
jgi:CRP/FNR family cyclic AMP-dependent transcriptional regulator